MFIADSAEEFSDLVAHLLKMKVSLLSQELNPGYMSRKSSARKQSEESWSNIWAYKDLQPGKASKELYESEEAYRDFRSSIKCHRVFARPYKR